MDTDNNTPMKRCTKCGEAKPLTSDYFHRSKNTRDGFITWCKTCMKENYRANQVNRIEKAKAWYHTHAEQAAERERERRLTSDQYERKKERQKIHRKENRDYYNQYNRDHRRNNPHISRARKNRRRARILSLPSNFEACDWQRALEHFNYSCAVCGRPRGLWHTLAQDHWIALTDPRPDNPGTVAWNIVPLCHGVDGCNNSKHNKDPQQWLIERFGKRQADKISKDIHLYLDYIKEQRDRTRWFERFIDAGFELQQQRFDQETRDVIANLVPGEWLMIESKRTPISEIIEFMNNDEPGSSPDQ